jgi:hypothetical protein
MKPITIRLSIKAAPQEKLWELCGISTPVRYVVVTFLPEHREKDNSILVSCHLDNTKVLRLAKLRFWKQAWGISVIQGYNGKYRETVHLTVPHSWKEKKSISIPINNFLRYFLDETWKDF